MKSETKDTSKNQDNTEKKDRGHQGFASMPKEQVREIAREGGKHSHDTNAKKKSEGEGRGHQGFASMPKEQVREIAREGGKHSHDTNAKKKS